MGLLDKQDRVSFYDGDLRVVASNGAQRAKFPATDYHKHIGQHVESWTYIKFPFLPNPGWKGFVDGQDSGVYRVAPLARLNVADGMATPRAQEEYERMYDARGGKPAHCTLAYHWARLIELLQAAETMEHLATSDLLYCPDVRNLDLNTPREGFGCVEAPRGTLIHHYQTDPGSPLSVSPPRNGDRQPNLDFRPAVGQVSIAD